MIYSFSVILLILYGVQSMKNGRPAAVTEFPFVLSIQYQLFHLCSGTIIDEYHILTIAHAVVPHSVTALFVVPGRITVTWPYLQSSTIKKVYLHPQYQEVVHYSGGHVDLYWAHDIAILRLTEPLPFDFSIGPIPFSTTNLEVLNCLECVLISWNYFDDNLEMVNLMWDFVYMVENKICEQWSIQVLPNEQCFIDYFKTAFISSEDLGSPIICEGSMVGFVAKEARREQPTSPTTFLSMSKYSDLISEIINDGEMAVQPEEFPYIVSIWRGNEHICGGLILNTNQVITAAQCLRNSRRNYRTDEFKIATGNRVPPSNGDIQWYRIEHIKIHPYYLTSHYDGDASWGTEHNIGIMILSTPFSWSPIIRAFRLSDTDDVSTSQLCQILHWKRKFTESKERYMELTKSTALLIEQPHIQLRQYQIIAKELYSKNSAEFDDIGNPILCGGYPFGIMVRSYVINEEETPSFIFLRLRPYTSTGFFLDSIHF